MILKALYDYYHRCGDLPPMGYRTTKISFLIRIDKDGNFLDIEDRRSEDKKSAQKFIVLASSRSSDVKPYFFYDKIEYVFGNSKKDDSKKTLKRHKAFVAQCQKLSEKYPESEAFRAVCLFYEKSGIDKVKSSSYWETMVKSDPWVSFILKGKTEIIAEAEELENEVIVLYPCGKRVPHCLIKGEQAVPVETTTATMIPGSQATARLVSFQENSGYDSYGKSKGYNAPISQEAEAAYTTALLHMLDDDSRNKFYIGDRTFLFWASSNKESANAMEESMFNLFGSFSADADDPNRQIEEVRRVFLSICSGELPSDSSDKFYILGLAPNKARLAVVYWNEIEIREFAKLILRHFDDMDIVDGRTHKNAYYGIYQMMVAVTLGGEKKKIQPNLPESTIKSIFQGLPYPHTLFSSSLRRIRAELNDEKMKDKYGTSKFYNWQITRFAILKAFLNRNNNNNKPLTVMLDKENKNQGYLCGRLFAVLEYAQKEANTIKERYMNAASSTPSTVFPTLLNLSIHHVEKFENEGEKIRIDRLKQEIIDMLPSDGFPSHLDLNDQGRFFVGYYQQKKDIYTAKKDKTAE